MTIETLLAKDAIRDLVHLYCRGIDRADGPTLRGIYWPDAIEDRGEGLFIGNAHDWVAWTLTLLPVFAVTQHAIQNILIEVEGDTAFGETYFSAYHRFAPRPEGAEEGIAWPDSDSEFILAGRYLDRFERRDGVWKIAHRQMINDWCRTQPVGDGWFAENPTAYRAVRDLSDTRAR